MTVEAVRLLRVAALKMHIAAIEELSHRLSSSEKQTPISPELFLSLKKDTELFPELAQSLSQHIPFERYREKCNYIHEKLLKTLEHTLASVAAGRPPRPLQSQALGTPLPTNWWSTSMSWTPAFARTRAPSWPTVT